MVRLRHYDGLGTARFVTLSCYHNHQLLTDERRIRIVLEELDAVRNKYGLLIYAFVVMPEHLHLVLRPPDNIKLGAVLREMKSRSARRIFADMRVRGVEIPPMLIDGSRGEVGPKFWQLRGYDHNCRSLEATQEKIRYCHSNPVKRGLASSPEDWPWSSAGVYYSEVSGALRIDQLETKPQE